MRRVLWPLTGAFGLMLAVFGAGSLGLAISDREPPIVYEHVRALSDTVPQGGSIEVEFTVHRLRICDVTAKRWLTDSAGEVHSIPTFTRGPRITKWAETYRRTITVPDAAAIGPASYSVDLSYTCNLVHRLGWPIEVHSPPIRFEITARPIIILPLLREPDDDG